MNNILKIILSLILTFSIINCKSTKQEDICLNLNNTDYDIIVRVARDNKKSVIGIQFPQNILIKNKSLFKKSFTMISYRYNDSITKWRNLGIELYTANNQELKRFSNNQRKTIPAKGSLEYVYYTRHFLDSSKLTQQQFNPYIEKMLAENKDTLHIGTVADFKKNHKELFEKLTKNDSISIQFLDGKKLGERITVPVEW